MGMMVSVAIYEMYLSGLKPAAMSNIWKVNLCKCQSIALVPSFFVCLILVWGAKKEKKANEAVTFILLSEKKTKKKICQIISMEHKSSILAQSKAVLA